ncbi:methyltransferase domain-containing protein [Acetobacteraceae bacterium]|nr:methyltransferase domain-containing protein [Candidatus Parcubacteria bacterium]
MKSPQIDKKYGLLHLLSHVYKGQTPGRILMNIELSKYTLRGKVADIGGGHRPDYFTYFKQDPGAEVLSLDGLLQKIDFEKDRLPFEDGSIDTVILCNVLEHMYDYKHLLSEIKRIMAPQAQLIGWVPFWCNYHPDPHDYFRYTHEALEKIFHDTGFEHTTIKRVGRSPIYANLENIILSVPRIFRPLLYVWYAGFDKVFLALRPKSAKRCPLGFLFVGSK